MHTPGPWKADRLHPEFVSHDVAVRYVDAGHHEICTLYGARGTTGEANARLIAAAPDMLDALQTLMGPIDGLQANLDAAQKARAAIAKATGR